MQNDITCEVVTRTIKGREFKLQLDFHAFAALEQLTGRNFLDPKALEDLNITNLTAVFWAGIARTGDGITLQEVRNLGFKYAPEMLEAVRAAWRASNEVPEPVE